MFSRPGEPPYDVISALATFREFTTATASEPAGQLVTEVAAELAAFIGRNITAPADRATAGTASVLISVFLAHAIESAVPPIYLPITTGLAGTHLLEGRLR
jgi:hypothetical protein